MEMGTYRLIFGIKMRMLAAVVGTALLRASVSQPCGSRVKGRAWTAPRPTFLSMLRSERVTLTYVCLAGD